MIKSAEIVGQVSLLYHREPIDRSNERCICCPGFPSHVYGIRLDLPAYKTQYPDHFGRRVDLWIESVFPFKKLEGKKIKITVELVPDDTPMEESRAK